MSLIEFFNKPQEKNVIISSIEEDRTVDYKELKFEDFWNAFLYATKSGDFLLPENYTDYIKENYKEEIKVKISDLLSLSLDFLSEKNSSKYESEFAILTFEIDSVYNQDEDCEIRKMLLEIVKSIDYKKFEAATENFITMLSVYENGFNDLLSFLENASVLGEKETTIMSFMANSPVKNEEYYKFLRSTCKNDDNEDILEIILNCVEDYGDAKAVSFLRTLAKKYYEKIDNAAAKGEDTTKYRDIFYMILGAVENLGGNVEI